MMNGEAPPHPWTFLGSKSWEEADCVLLQAMVSVLAASTVGWVAGILTLQPGTDCSEESIWTTFF